MKQITMISELYELNDIDSNFLIFKINDPLIDKWSKNLSLIEEVRNDLKTGMVNEFKFI